MKTELILERIASEAASVARIVPGASWYLFGSATHSPASAEDIDVLILYSGPEDAATIRRCLRKLCLAMPLHLLLLTAEEERELDFIASQSCLSSRKTIVQSVCEA